MIDVVALSVFIALFVLVTVLGFIAANWRRGDLDLLHEWGLAGRRFGTVVTWFLLGGDLYTAYTFIAVPALVFGTGATGFFALPYTIIVYPFVFVVMPRLWSVARRHHYITAADFVRGRYESRGLALAVAFPGILATMPYIALQLVGIQVVIAAMGITGDAPLVIAFVILAAYTYFSGLRAPAVVALVKDVIMSIAAANLFTRNVYREYFHRRITDREESNVAKLTSLVVKFGALVFIIFLPTQYAINLQLLGGVWIIQTLPTIVIGLYTRWLHRWALLIGWAIGMLAGTAMAVSQNFTSVYPLQLGGVSIPGYAALYALILNLAVTVVLTWVFNAMTVESGRDETAEQDYSAVAA